MALHEVQLKGYSVRPGNLSLGTYDSYGIEQLHVTLDDTWSRLAIDATFHNTPNDKGVTMLVDADGLVTVPPEACKRNHLSTPLSRSGACKTVCSASAAICPT